MNLFLLMLEIFVLVAAIALVPRSELRISRARVTHNERDQDNSLRS